MTTATRKTPPSRKQAEIVIACDGSCLKNPGGATGWAWVASDGRWASASQPTGTNQVAELWGVLSVLRDFPVEALVIQIDSEYAMKAATTWARGWARNGWRNREGKPIKNLALIQAIYVQMSRREAPVRFQKVPGHDPDNRWPLNTAADKRAREAAVRAKRAGQAMEFSGFDEDVVMVDPPRPHEVRPLKTPGLMMCESCDQPISPSGECRCSM